MSPAARRIARGGLIAALCCGLLACESLIGLRDRKYEAADAGMSASVPDAGSAGDGGSTVDAGDVVSLCKDYCELAVSACPDDYAIYHSASDCEPACQLLLNPEQIACRVDELTKAQSSSEFWDHCQGATLGGSTACGGNCQNYCAFMDKVCTGDNRDPAESMDCVTKCKALSDRENMLQGLPADTSRYSIDTDHEGDTLQCRLVHLSIAARPGFADAHCWHAALAPRPHSSGAANPCATGMSETAPHCEDYCHIVMNACTGANKVYENEAQCNAVCAMLPLGSVSDTVDVDSVGCRKIHAYNALIIDAGKHCPHAGPGGAGICSSKLLASEQRSDCPTYCRLLQMGCADAFKAKFGSGAGASAMCEAACEPLREAEPSYLVSLAPDHPFACRMLAVSRALEKPKERASFCPSAVGDAACGKL